ncbi:GH18509 [Drosophila grimshawi]|uniref:GH18509 n=1 Tax=Drosophila grimshawi TaxID=7222 RepID=B4JID9_DROGR|nr:GH18510 [Drosophila grimshawi]EDV93022.1 GH18509 [Drosophila grimshawi]
MTKAELRRKFEACIWKSQEKFAMYFERKTLMAQELDMYDEELLDGLITGIPNERIRIQAQVQCFDNPTKMQSQMCCFRSKAWLDSLVQRS